MYRQIRSVVITLILGSALHGGSLRVLGPAQRSMATMVTDIAGQRVIMYGGQDYGLSGQCYNEIWALDPATESWQEIIVTPPTPPARRNPALAYNPNTQQIFMFGGRTAYTFYNDLWVLDLTPGLEHWTQLSPSGMPPSPRTEVTGIYDQVANRLIFFGGDTPGGRTNETWQFDIGSNTWSMLNPSGPLPLERSAYAAVYHPSSHRMVVFSGCSSPIASDVWALGLTYGMENWQQLFPTGAAPTGRGQPFCALDENHDALIVGFGYDYPGYIVLLSDVWSLDLTNLTWQQTVTSGTVFPRRGSCASYSPQTGLVYIFGGDNGIATSTGYALYTDQVWALETPMKAAINSGRLQVVPNPVRLPCRITTYLETPGEIDMTIIDSSGRLVKTMLEQKARAGSHTMEWDGMDQNNKRVAAGTYFVRLHIDGAPVTEKVVLVR